MLGLADINNCFVSCERVFDRTLVGKPVAVLSNNDGCCIARSNEFKALGIAMGTPYYQLKSREKTLGLEFRSSNYELYGDMSRRFISILRAETLEVEQYSIDEAFFQPPSSPDIKLTDFGLRLRKKILRWIGLPCSIGFAPTKTLAKIANHIAKKNESGVYVLPDDPGEILTSLDAAEVWGVGRRLELKLRAEQIFTANHLRLANEDILRAIGGITLVKTARELNGKTSIQETAYDADPNSVSCSRSFGEPVTTLEGLSESLASYTSQAAEKLRRHSLLAAGCNIYAQIFASGGGGEIVSRTVLFSSPTDATNEMLLAIKKHVKHLFFEGVRYRKTGVCFFGLEKVGAERQLDLFASSPPSTSSPLYKAIDSLNSRYGKARVFSASEGLGPKSWKIKRDKCSKRYSTRWDELLTVS